MREGKAFNNDVGGGTIEIEAACSLDLHTASRLRRDHNRASGGALFVDVDRLGCGVDTIRDDDLVAGNCRADSRLELRDR